MPTYLMSWNPKRWTWHGLEESIARIRADQHLNERWSCGVNRSVRSGDRIFLIRLGLQPKGIIASGWAISNVHQGKHWDWELARHGKQALYVDIDLDVLLNPDTEDILPRTELNKGVLAEMHWDTQASGVRIPDHVARELERRWSQFLRGRNNSRSAISEEDLVDPATFFEGSFTQVSLNIYERNPKAREACLQHYGYDCFVCGFNFRQAFGNVGDKFIHVHHLKPLSAIGKRYKLDPIRDLRPVCPNCHAIIHKRNPAYTIDEIRQFINGK
jgi:5-methylcytosine-specific restriction protein A